MNIPIYRAKKIDSDEYVTGHYFNRKNMLGGIIYHKIDFSTTCDKIAEIDILTLAIHFPDMIDSNNKPIFASLSEDGKGGDNATHKLGYGVTFKYINGMFISLANKFNEFKIIGIQQ